MFCLPVYSYVVYTRYHLLILQPTKSTSTPSFWPPHQVPSNTTNWWVSFRSSSMCPFFHSVVLNLFVVPLGERLQFEVVTSRRIPLLVKNNVWVVWSLITVFCCRWVIDSTQIPRWPVNREYWTQSEAIRVNSRGIHRQTLVDHTASPRQTRTYRSVTFWVKKRSNDRIGRSFNRTRSIVSLHFFSPSL